MTGHDKAPGVQVPTLSVCESDKCFSPARLAGFVCKSSMAPALRFVSTGAARPNGSGR